MVEVTANQQEVQRVYEIGGVEALQEMRRRAKEKDREIGALLFQGMQAARAITDFIYAFGQCSAYVGGPERRDSLQCQLRLGHEGLHVGANSVRWGNDPLKPKARVA